MIMENLMKPRIRVWPLKIEGSIMKIWVNR